MRRDSALERVRAVVLAALLVTSVLAMTVTVAGPAAAAANSASFDVTEDATQSDDNITVTGDTGSSGNNVTFLIQDPVDDDVATVTKDTNNNNKSFEVNINLSSLSFGGGNGSLDEGTATILADEGDSFEGSEASDTFVVDDKKPTGSIAKPTDGAEENSQPVIEGNASDNTEVASVDLVIQNESSDYYNGSAFVDNETTVSADGTEDWSYNTSDEGISSDGEYDVKVEVTDTAGNVFDVSVPHPEGETRKTSYTVDSTQPTLSSLSVTDADSDGNITDGDTVDVSVDVTDATSGVNTVTVDASELGGDANEELTVDSGDTYTTSFDVSDPTAGDGDVNLTVTATDNFGNSNQDTAVDALTLKTSVAGVGNLTIDHKFVGIVKDDSELVVNATDITDPQGNTISGPTTVDISVTGTNTEYSATVTNGSLNTTIDTTEISNTAGTGDTTVEIAQADAGADSADVELVHEALDLDEGYQAVGTPMAAENLVFEDVNDLITTYDPTAENEETEWVVTDGEQAGEGYYIEGDSDDARVGYIFDTNPNEGPEARALHEGWNLVGTSVDLSKTTSHDATTDLGGAVTVDSNVEVWTRDESQDLDQSDGSSGYVEGGSSTSVSAFDGYFVYIENTEETRNVDIIGYDAGGRN